jgi:hypothetical protein
MYFERMAQLRILYDHGSSGSDVKTLKIPGIL